MQILKALPSGENMIEKDLIINLLKHKIVNDLQLRKYNDIDTLYLKQRLDNLVSLDYIKRNIDSNTNVISYSYCWFIITQFSLIYLKIVFNLSMVKLIYI